MAVVINSFIRGNGFYNPGGILVLLHVSARDRIYVVFPVIDEIPVVSIYVSISTSSINLVESSSVESPDFP